jgi:hypothetical protein
MVTVHGCPDCHSERAIFAKQKGERRISPLSASEHDLLWNQRRDSSVAVFLRKPCSLRMTDGVRLLSFTSKPQKSYGVCYIIPATRGKYLKSSPASNPDHQQITTPNFPASKRSRGITLIGSSSVPTQACSFADKYD